MFIQLGKYFPRELATQYSAFRNTSQWWWRGRFWQTSRADRKHLPNASALTLFYWHEVTRLSRAETNVFPSKNTNLSQQSYATFWSELAGLSLHLSLCVYVCVLSFLILLRLSAPPLPSGSFCWCSFRQLSAPVILLLWILKQNRYAALWDCLWTAAAVLAMLFGMCLVCVCVCMCVWSREREGQLSWLIRASEERGTGEGRSQKKKKNLF